MNCLKAIWYICVLICIGADWEQIHVDLCLMKNIVFQEKGKVRLDFYFVNLEKGIINRLKVFK